MTNQQEVAERIAQLRREKSARERKDVTQAMIAEAVGLVPETYSRYENGRRKVPEDVITALAKYFGTTRAFIRYGEETVARVTADPEPVAKPAKKPDGRRKRAT
jgi:transcriptional regulator with XRE-family HTH domain